MNAIVRKRVEKWIEALRSGEYQQGFEYLRQKSADGKDQFCCLGVACDIYGKRRGVAWEGDDSCGVFLDNDALLPDLVSTYFGLREGMFVGGSLWTMNDSGKSFKQIARFIEQQLKTNSKRLFA